MIKNLKQFIQKKYTKELNHVSEGAVQFALQKDYSMKAWNNRHIIDQNYIYFLTNVLNIYKYLMKDFRIKKYDGIQIKQEIKDIKDNDKRISTVDGNIIIRKYRKINLSTILIKWQTLSIILKEYPQLINFFKKICGENEYKSINFEYELQKVKELDFLIEDFSILKLKAQNDTN